MPKENAKKTKSEHRSRFAAWKVLAFLGRVLLGLALATSLNIGSNNLDDISFGSAQLKNVEIADTAALRSQGLSGRDGLSDDSAMLFVFDATSSQLCFWMKDMQFPIDIIWLDESKKVVHIEREVKPDSYPQNFCSDAPARYVLEVQAGLSQKAGVDVGSQL